MAKLKLAYVHVLEDVKTPASEQVTSTIKATCGAPVVAYDSGGLPDVVQVDAGGTLVPAGDIDALANALAIPAHDARESSRRGRLAHERMRHRFSPEAVAAQYLGIYHAALDADDGRRRMPA